MRSILTLSFIGLLAASSSAQFGVGAGLNYTYFGKSAGYNPFGLGVGLNYAFTERTVTRLSFVYHFTSEETESIIVKASGNLTEPQTAGGRLETVISGMQFNLDYQYYFGGKPMGEGFYLGLGAGLILLKYKYETSGYDRSLYLGGYDQDLDLAQWALRITPGYSLGLPVGQLYAEAGLNLSANTVNGQEISIEIGSSLFGSAGYRMMFGEPRSGLGKKTGKGSGGGKASKKSKRQKSSAARKKHKKKKR